VIKEVVVIESVLQGSAQPALITTPGTALAVNAN